ncbi:ATP-binding protein [Blastopirellula marina]|uniref:Probable ferredoxin MJ0251-putative Fe-S containing oxidoreductase n=1 Tax=Blastopirellula marina DSM 3645 TaxID=314230 RepID=A4A1C4_9BACT|nr:ferredoxin family protein [Blastopirellula marina]EAQ77476.1 probable ferredoxin MJ0251-putative Fe-S containing oxidoreductase [Blastopirellula marina DSM 3645]
MAKKLTVVLSQGQSQNPAKRNLEEEIVARLLFEPGIEVTIVPHLYDLKPDGPGMLCLEGISGNMVIISWMFERAARWTLDRNGIHGKIGTSLLTYEVDEDELDELEDEEEKAEKQRVADSRPPSNRYIYCLDLRVSNKVDEYVEEIQRIAAEQTPQVMQLGGLTLDPSPSNGNGNSNGEMFGVTPLQQLRHDHPTNDTYVGANHEAPIEPIRIEETGGRRWYPVIDYSRCTNCMECIDFCLFGVYGVDGIDTILVEQPDNCRKGCPACSRVCPENAIIFPQHKTPTIAGSDIVAEGGLKIDLSQLFGKPAEDPNAADTAIRERDEQLLLAGRDAVGASVGMPKRQADKPAEDRDELDDLIDAVDELDI